MATPYILLGINHDANDVDVKQAYLKKVRDYPPERYPEQFRRIRQAYELLKDEKSRMAYRLFYQEPLSSSEVLAALFIEQKRSVPTEKLLLNALKESLIS